MAAIVTLLAAVSILAGCAAAPPRPDVAPPRGEAPSPGADEERWGRDVDAYRERRERFDADIARLREELRALAAAASFGPLEDRIAALAARVRAGEVERPDDTLVATLWTMSLGELLLFQTFLALSTEVVKLEATHAELESVRLDLAVRRLRLGLATVAGSPSAPAMASTSVTAGEPAIARIPGAELVDRPLAPPFPCARYPVGRVEFVACR